MEKPRQVLQLEPFETNSINSNKSTSLPILVHLKIPKLLFFSLIYGDIVLLSITVRSITKASS